MIHPLRGAGCGNEFMYIVPFIIALMMVWSAFWKGLSLWHAARRGDIRWFIALLILNTAGILDAIYLFLVAKVPEDELFKAKK